MTPERAELAGPEPRAISITEALADWHSMICEPVGVRSAGCVSEEVRVPSSDRARSASCSFLGAQIAPAIGEGTLDLVSFDDDFILLSMRGEFRRDLNYVIAGEGWTRLHFRRSARSSMDFFGIGESEFEGPLCQILHQPEGVADEEWIEGGVPLEWVTLLIRPELLVERFHLDSVRLDDRVRRLANGSDDFLLQNWSLSPAMIRAMSQLLGTDYQGDLRRVHLEAKCIELICMMSDVLSERESSCLPVKLSTSDIDRLHEARALLARRFAEAPSVEQLAREVGLNRNKLSYGFKHLFDTTISDFCAESRLQAAWEMLCDTDLPIGRIAHRVGYRQPAAFSTAFKKRYGMTPRQARLGNSVSDT